MNRSLSKMKFKELENLSEKEKEWKRLLFSSDGAVLIKFGRRGSPQLRSFHITQDLRLHWRSTKLLKGRGMVSLSLHRVTRIQRGHTTKQFHRFVKSHYGGQSKKSFSLIYDSNLKSLDLMCNLGQDPASLVSLFEKLVAISKARHGEADIAFYNHHWRLSDQDQSGALDFDEVISLVQRINIKLSKSCITKKIAEVDENKDGIIQFPEFVMLMRLLSQRFEVEHLWIVLLDGNFEDIFEGLTHREITDEERIFMRDGKLDVEKFQQFLAQIQDEHYTTEEVENLIEELENENELTEESNGKLSYHGFLAYISGVSNEAFDPDRELHTEQMDEPFSHYWISSSHNTYLEGDQLTSASSLNRYIQDLRRGCRCVELDCWDSPEGPIVYHGHTLTGKIKFSEAIEVIKEHAFTLSDYPVILSLENHCSIPQQVMMANCIKEILGDTLAVDTLKRGKLASPASLKCRIIIKGSLGNLATNIFDACERLENEILEADENSEEIWLNDEAEDSVVFEAKLGLLPVEEAIIERVETKVKIAQELSDITSLKGVKFKGFEEAKEHPNSHMSSFSEKKSEKLLKSSKKEWIEYNQYKISRIYPAAYRVDSSNYDPTPHWSVGSQIVALNFQTKGMPMYLNHGRFRDNGGCGYVLKPECLLESSPSSRSLEKWRLIIWIWSAQQLPKPNDALKGEIIDPYVKIGIHGSTSQHQSTRAITDNGFNPIWGEKFSFEIETPSLDLLSLVVMDKDTTTQDDFIAYATMPISAIRNGFRRISLFSSDGTNHGAFQHSSLLCQFKIQQKIA